MSTAGPRRATQAFSADVACHGDKSIQMPPQFLSSSIFRSTSAPLSLSSLPLAAWLTPPLYLLLRRRRRLLQLPAWALAPRARALQPPSPGQPASLPRRVFDAQADRGAPPRGRRRPGRPASLLHRGLRCPGEKKECRYLCDEERERLEREGSK